MLYRGCIFVVWLCCCFLWQCNAGTPTSKLVFKPSPQNPASTFTLIQPSSTHAKDERILLRIENLSPENKATLHDDPACQNALPHLADASSRAHAVDFSIDLEQDGVYTYYAQVGSPESNHPLCLGPVSYRLDRIAPVITDVSDGSGSYIALSTSESDNPVYVYDDDACTNEVGELLPDGNGNDIVFAPGLTENGVFLYWVQTQDNAGNLSDCVGPLFYMYLGASPNSMISMPNQLAINTGTLEYNVDFGDVFSASMAASDVTVQTTGDVQYSVQVLNGTTKTPTIVLTVTGGNGTINSVSIPEGLGDNLVAGTPAATQNTVVRVDNIAPNVTLSLSPSTPSPGDFNPILFDITATTPTDLASVALFKNDPTCSSPAANTGGHPAQTSLSLASDTIETGTGTYLYYLQAIDAAGNASGCVGPVSYQLSAPDPVSNLNISAKGCDYLSIGWTKPNENGTTIVNYQTRYKPSALLDESNFVLFDPGISTQTFETIGPAAPHTLTVDTVYDFQMRTVTSNGAISPWSNTYTGATLPNTLFFCGNDNYGAFNTGGATTSKMVAFDDGTTVEHYNQSNLLINTYTLDAGETQGINSTQFDYVLSDKPLYIAGRRGSGGNTRKANVVWSSKDWAGKQFLFNGSRAPNHILSVYAFEDATIDVINASGVVVTQTINAGQSTTFSVGNGSYEVDSTGTLVAYLFSSSGNPMGNNLQDPMPLLPLSTDIIGYTGSISGAQISSLSNGNVVNARHSNDVLDTRTVNIGNPQSISARGNGNVTLYQSEAVHVTSSAPIVARSNADSNGNCSAPFLPVTMMRKRYAINVYAEWVAFAALESGDIEVVDPQTGSVVATITLVQNDPTPPTASTTPWKARIDRSTLLNLVSSNSTTEGVIFRSTIAFAAWYEPQNDNFAADDDETLLYGTND
jgi:hypothetical protein